MANELPAPTLATADYLLLKCRLPGGTKLALVAQQFCTMQLLALHRAAWLPENEPPGTSFSKAFVYARLPVRTRLPVHGLLTWQKAWQRFCPLAQAVSVSRLELALDQPGCSQNETAAFHYVVETDPQPGWADEIFRWYDTEHMPGLAKVPGCVHARRLLNHDHGWHAGLDHGPLSLACYDLVTAETLGSAPWLAVRGTAWSSITRPHFSNTRRTMMPIAA